MLVPHSPHPIAMTARRALAAALIAVAAPVICSPISCAHAQPAGFESLDDDWGATDADILHWLPTRVGGPVVDGSLELADVVPDVVSDVGLEAATETEAGAEPAWATSKDGSTDDAAPGLVDSPSSVAASEVDGNVRGAAEPEDDAADDAVAAALAPSPGELLITEVMFDSSGPEPQSEWFEVYNATDSPLSLNGLTIVDGYSNMQVIAATPPPVVAAKAYALLVRNRALAVIEFLPAASIVYEYSSGLAPEDGIEIDNSATGAVALWNGAVELADVPYGGWNMASIGSSIELVALSLPGSQNPGGWCIAQHAWETGYDFGTPGAPNDCP
jgi:lamin tail-like protein